MQGCHNRMKVLNGKQPEPQTGSGCVHSFKNAGGFDSAFQRKPSAEFQTFVITLHKDYSFVSGFVPDV